MIEKRSSRKLGTGSKYKNMEVAESAAGLLIYKELDYSCIHGGKHFSSISIILSNFGNTSRIFSAQSVVQYILDGTIQKAQTWVFYHMTYDSIVMT
jgi:hypothetical protein